MLRSCVCEARRHRVFVRAPCLGNEAHHHYRFNETSLALAACEQALLNVDDLEIHDLEHPAYFVQERSVPQQYDPSACNPP